MNQNSLILFLNNVANPLWQFISTIASQKCISITLEMVQRNTQYLKFIYLCVISSYFRRVCDGTPCSKCKLFIVLPITQIPFFSSLGCVYKYIDGDQGAFGLNEHQNLGDEGWVGRCLTQDYIFSNLCAVTTTTFS